jgi:hypothetical protein
MGKKGTGFSPSGGLFFGNVVTCTGQDDSMYCKIVKVFNVLMMILVVLMAISFLYSLIKSKK